MKTLKFTIFLIIFLIGAFFIFVDPSLAVVLVLISLGFGVTKTDRRFKTGHKPGGSASLVLVGFLWFALAIVLHSFGYKDRPSTQSSPSSQSVQTQSRQQTVTAQDSAVRTQSSQQTVTAQDSAISLLNQMIAIAADDGGVGRAEELISLKQRIDALPKPAQGDKQRAWMANDNGLAAYKAGQYEQAKEYFLSAYQADPTDVEIAGNLALVYLNLGDSKQVIETLTTALTLDPGRASSWLYLATYYALQGQQQVAVACYALTYHFAPNPNKVLELLQKLTTDSGQPKVQQAAQQALQLSLFQEETGD